MKNSQPSKLPEKKKQLPVLGQILKKVAGKIGATVIVEPVWEVVGQITFKSGRHSYFKYNTIDLNPMGSSEIARDKDYSNFFIQKLGYPIVPGSKTFFTDSWAKTVGTPKRTIDSAYAHAQRLGMPVIVKPNSGSQGSGVALVHTKKEFYDAVRLIFKQDKIVLVQQPVVGKDYRLVVLDNKIISAYERIPLSVVGDGKATIEKLLARKSAGFVASSRDTQIKTSDPRIKIKLARQGLTLLSVPAKGVRIFLLDNANLSTGGDSIDITDRVHPEFRKLAIDLTRDMGLRLCGVDLMIDGDISEKPRRLKASAKNKKDEQNYWVLEINSAPGLDHYAKIGKTQEKIVEDLYLEVLKHMER